MSTELNSSAALAEFEKISAERKYGIGQGEIPDWYITQGYMLYERKYAFQGESVRGGFRRVANHLAKYVEDKFPGAAEEFFNIMWNGYLAPSTPVMCNTGTDRGHSVSCSGSYIDDSVYGFYKNELEVAMLSQKGYGTSSYLGDIRPRGSKISSGGEAAGAVPVFDSHLDTSNKISQGNQRRGQWAGYLPVDHGDFWEMAGYVQKNNATANIGWMFSDDFIHKLKICDTEAIKRWNRVLYLRARFGKGYIWKHDHANRLSPAAIKACGIPIRASNLCTEISLPESAEYTFSCVLSSMNAANYHKYKSTKAVYWATIMLDCVVEDTLRQAEGIPGFERLYAFTRDFRALGLGTLGFHSLLQENSIAFESLEAQWLSMEIAEHHDTESMKASQDLAKAYGESKWCKGLGYRNATRLANAPNTQSALLCGGMSQSTEPFSANTYIQPVSAGEMTRMNPTLVKLLKEKEVYSLELMKDLQINHMGSVQHMDCLNTHEKQVFRTAFEINQHSIIRLASQRQRKIDQAQSINTWFDTDEDYIADVTRTAVLDDNIISLYYQRSARGVKASKGECLSCEG